MSIIERATKLIDPLEDESIQPAVSRSSVTDSPNSIERAVSEGSDSSILAEPEELAVWRRPEASDRGSQVEEKWRRGEPKTPSGFLPGARSSSTGTDISRPVVKIDRAHLHKNGVIQPDGSRTPVAECFRLIKSQLLTSNVARAGGVSSARAIMVTSALPGEGKTFCAVNLAISMALEKGRSVLLVDGDVANPSVPSMLGLNSGRGLMDVLLDDSIDVESLVQQTDIGRLGILQAGTAHRHATELLASETMRVLVQQLAGRYDDRLVIFDSPPLLLASESGVLASHMEKIVVVVEAGGTPEQAIEDALGRIDTSKVAGMLLNKGRSVRRGYGYGAYA